MDFQISKQQWHNYIKLHRDINKNNIFTVVPYSKGISETFRNICWKAGVQFHFKVANTVKELLVTPKDKDSICKKGGCLQIQMWPTRVYHRVYKEDWQEFWWKVQRASQDSFPHLWPTTGHIIKLDNFPIVGRESQGCH